MRVGHHPLLISLSGTRAPSAYNLWMKDNLKKYKEDHPNVAQKDIMKAVCAIFPRVVAPADLFARRSARSGRTRPRTRAAARSPSPRRQRRPRRPSRVSRATRPRPASPSPRATTSCPVPPLPMHTPTDLSVASRPRVASPTSAAHHRVLLSIASRVYYSPVYSPLYCTPMERWILFLSPVATPTRTPQASAGPAAVLAHRVPGRPERPQRRLHARTPVARTRCSLHINRPPHASTSSSAVAHNCQRRDINIRYPPCNRLIIQ